MRKMIPTLLAVTLAVSNGTEASAMVVDAPGDYRFSTLIGLLGTAFSERQEVLDFHLG